ncbi:MAG: hypothetical protein LUE61_09860 [Clostridiales bacterium]|nr:hypothetical protein [Clostridiales bacterium]
MKANNSDKLTFGELRELPFLKTNDYAKTRGLSIGYVRGLVDAGTLPMLKSGRCAYIDAAAADVVLHALAKD